MTVPCPKALQAAALTVLALMLSGSGCLSDGDTAEEHRKLSLRIEHLPPSRALAGEEVELSARVQSSLEGPRIEAWVRVLGDDGGEEKIDLELSADGEAVARIPGGERGEVVRYVIEAKDAAGLVVALPRNAEDGRYYTLRFEGPSSRILGGISFVSALLAALLYVGAGAAAVQNLRGRMSVGPAGLLGGLAAILVIVGLFVLGGVHAFQVTGRPWPGDATVFALSRGDLAIVTLLWAGNIGLGRRVLLDDEPDGAPRGERGFAVTGVVAAILTIFFAIF
jgi:hypothetical protein